MRIRRLLVLVIVGLAFIFVAGCNKSSSSSSLRLNLSVSPDHPRMSKPITLQVHVANPQGQPVTDAQVNGELTMKLMEMGATKLSFAPKGNGNYEAQVKGVDMSGPWALAVTAQQGSTTSKQTFDVNVFD